MSVDVVNTETRNESSNTGVDLARGAPMVDLAKLVTTPARQSTDNVNALDVLRNYIRFGDVDPESANMLPELTEVIAVLADVGHALDQRDARAQRLASGQDVGTASTANLVTHGYRKGGGTQVADKPVATPPKEQGVAQDDKASPDLKWTPPTTPVVGR